METTLAAPVVEHVYPTGLRKWIIVLTTVSAAIIELIDTSIVNVGLTNIAGSLGATIEDAAWVITAYAIANVIVIPMTSFLQHYFGRKRYYVASIILFTLASFGCGFADNLWVLVFFRFVQGIGGGALLSTSQAILFDAFPPAEKAIASALFGMGLVIGPTLGPTLGGYIIDNYHWSWMFYINVPIGIVATMLALAFVDKKPDEAHIDRRGIHIDYLGIMLLAVGVGSLQYVLERGEADDWFDDQTIRYLAGLTAIAIPLFIGWELRGTHSPVVNLRALKNRNLSVGMILLFVVGYGLLTSVLLYPLFVQRIIGYTATQTGVLLIPSGIFMVFAFAMVGRILARGVAPSLIVGVGYVAFIAFSFMMAGLNADASENQFIWSLIVRGVGLAFVNVPLISQSVSTLKPADMPTGIALSNMMRQLGGAFGVAISNTYIAQRTALHRYDLVSHLQPGYPEVTERLNALTQALMARGINALDATTGAYRQLEGIVNRQALMIAYLDAFRLVAIFFLLTFPLLFLLQNKKMDPETARLAAEHAH